MSRSILVVGATGKQGGAVINALLANKSDFQLLAVTRNASSPGAARLASKSPRISIVEGDLSNTEDLFAKARKAAQGSVWGAFSVQVPSTKKDANGVSLEEVQGKALVDSAIKHGVKHLVYTSVDRHGDRSSENPTDIPHFITKHNVEKHLISATKGTGTTWTILRPVAFMDNIDDSFFAKVFLTAWRQTLTKPLQLIAAEDIGIFGAMALMKPERFSGQAISLAGDELTFAQLDSLYKKKIGSPAPTTFGFIASILILLAKELRTMLAFFENEGYAADIPELKKMHPDLKDMAAYLEQNGKGAKKA